MMVGCVLLGVCMVCDGWLCVIQCVRSVCLISVFVVRCEVHQEKLSVYCLTCSECMCHQCALWGGNVSEQRDWAVPLFSSL